MTPPLPLHGLRVLDLTRVLAGPYCTMLLADLGAEVVKIERPGSGDDARQFGPFMENGDSAYFASINRGKKSVALDLKQEADRATFLRLVEKADVLVENFRPGTMESFGLPSQRLREINPRLIVASATGFGQTGPDSRRAAYDVIIQALSGLMSITGYDSSQPARVGNSISDILTGLFTALGIVAALRQCDATGTGCDLDLSMLECTVATLENAVTRFAVSGQPPTPLGTRHPSIAPFQAFQAADGQFVIAAGNDTLWHRLCEVLAAPELLADPKLATNRDRAANLDHLEACLNVRLAHRPIREWLALLAAAGVPAAPIRHLGEVVADPHLQARGIWHYVQNGDNPSLLTAGTPFVIDGHKPTLSPMWPKLGEHTERVLREWLGST
ncbi:MAG: CoA transferase [Planctomycetales bacterium]|nr:CoA transferase [Planctomycetales bacterium]